MRLAATDEWGNQAESTVKVNRSVMLSRTGGEGGTSTAVLSLSDMDFGHYYALVIGNNKHAYLPDLKTAEVDARGVADIPHSRYGLCEVAAQRHPPRHQTEAGAKSSPIVIADIENRLR